MSSRELIYNTGLMTIYFGRLEYNLDLLTKSVAGTNSHSPKQRASFSEKAKWIQDEIGADFKIDKVDHEPEWGIDALHALEGCRGAAKRRKDYIHAFIYMTGEGKMERWRDGDTAPIDATEMQNFANHVFDLGSAIDDLTVRLESFVQSVRNDAAEQEADRRIDEILHEAVRQRGLAQSRPDHGVAA